MDQENQVTQENAQNTTPTVSPTQSQTTEVGERKLFAILGYILPFLFFIPMLNDTSKNDPYVRTHADQQLTLLVIWLAWSVFTNVFFMMIPSGLYMLMPIVNIGLLVLVVIGIINAAQGQTKKLPLVGSISLIDKLFKN